METSIQTINGAEKVRNAYEYRAIDKKRGRRPSAATPLPICLRTVLNSDASITYRRHLQFVCQFAQRFIDCYSVYSFFILIILILFIFVPKHPQVCLGNLGPICADITNGTCHQILDSVGMFLYDFIGFCYDFRICFIRCYTIGNKC